MLKVVYISFFRLSIVFILYSLKLNYNVYCFWLDVRILFHRCSLREELANIVSFTFIENYRCLKSVQIRSYFWSVFSCIQSEYREIRTRNNSVFGHFSRSVCTVYCTIFYYVLRCLYIFTFSKMEPIVLI